MTLYKKSILGVQPIKTANYLGKIVLHIVLAGAGEIHRTVKSRKLGVSLLDW